MFHDGDQAKRDDKAAFFWLTQGALRGVTTAQVYLAQLYAAGEGTVKSTDKAQFWNEKAQFQQAMEAHAQAIAEAAKRDPVNWSASQLVGFLANLAIESINDPGPPRACVALANNYGPANLAQDRADALRAEIRDNNIKCPSDEDSILSIFTGH